MVQNAEDVEEEMLEMAIVCHVLSQGTEQNWFLDLLKNLVHGKDNWIKCDLNTIFDLCIVLLFVWKYKTSWFY